MQDLVLNPLTVRDAVAAALAEDLGGAGDITTNACIPAGTPAALVIASRAKGVISGVDLAEEAFRQIDPGVAFAADVRDGGSVEPGTVVARVSGPARSILSAERVALNFMGRMSGIASLTARYVERVAHTRARIVDTRKTTPLLRAFEKHAVRSGGGMNHRFGLDDAVLIKDNHIAVAGSIAAALRAAKAHAGHMVKIEIEVDTLAQLVEVLDEGADVVLLDNMSPTLLRQAVEMVGGRMLTEASGGINLDTVAAVAETGVDMISVGALTHSAPVMDLGLDVKVG
ncbi:carboxylating nicotinate-nucleotide diphosphorylase [Chelatococcus asaccharovorans]|uniref:carboxylating nicotinate-nucleotide diphosphorylase n=1 Tax=Chelatococcus asaccharovorans TaxID=28210 RepID=UPI00224C73D3|nr:carboxylating nicotinate-nucleotide diphosphorylase [Chelatococcus asaccharovorans]CAH1669721.1 putative nicotinate-nucleotide pyrophosphorylase (carboxylating) [Chelatococcus asaccharovorans]CAH1678822.1 putative nicotinate-nucleotide pyrophosphorylase (carboxylating) [Chelatococcus asaccharovorans]